MKNWILAGVLAILAIATQAQTTCVDPLACNFTELGECEFLDDNGMPCVTEGCAIPVACNFNPEADINGDGCTNLGDLLDLLAGYATCED